MSHGANNTGAVYQFALACLGNIIGQQLLDEVLKERSTINRTLRKLVDEETDHWGIQVEMVEMKDVEIPASMQRAMAREAEAVREKRARVIKAQAELDASHQLAEASRQIAENPAALELRRMQMISEVGAENNTTTLIMIPSDFVTLAKHVSQHLEKQDRSRPDSNAWSANINTGAGYNEFSLNSGRRCPLNLSLKPHRR